MSSDLKFRWVDAMWALKPPWSVGALLTQAALHGPRNDETEFRRSCKLLAADCGRPSEAGEKQAAAAYEWARAHGLIETFQKRQVGTRESDWHRLVIPESGDKNAPESRDKNPESGDKNAPESRDKNPESGDKNAPEYPQNPTEVGIKGNALTSGNDHVRVVEGDRKVTLHTTSASAPEPALDARNPSHAQKNTTSEPKRVCSRHPDGNRGKNFQPCAECVDVKKHNDKIKADSDKIKADQAWLAGAQHCVAACQDGYLTQPSKLAVFGQPKPDRTIVVIAPCEGCDPTHSALQHLEPLPDTANAWMVRCPHGTRRPGDKRDKPDDRLSQLTDEAGYQAIGLDAWAANDSDPDTASYAEYDAQENYSEAKNDAKKWFDAEQRWKRDVEVWLNKAQRLWLEAEAEYHRNVQAWLAAEACPLCDGRYIYALSENSPLILAPADVEAFHRTPKPAGVWAQHLEPGTTGTGREVYRVTCQHDLDANNDTVMSICFHAYDRDTTIIKAPQSRLHEAIQRYERWRAERRQTEIDNCNLCDGHGTQLGANHQPVMLQAIDDESEPYGEPIPLTCRHNPDANIAEFLDADTHELRAVSYEDVLPELNAALGKAIDDQLLAGWLAAERDYKAEQARLKAQQRAEELDLMADILTDRLALKLDQAEPWGDN
jgi:hypothetical protein